MCHQFTQIISLAIISLHTYVQTQSPHNFTSLAKKDDYPPKEEWYPKYHLAPPSGWMNDPNGLIYFNNYYHAFYQHNPFDPFPVADKISWGYARSKDMIHWEHLPVAIAPSIPEDKTGCFSGSAVNNSGILTLIYTGNSVTQAEGQVEVQCIATSEDTINFTKHGKVLGPPGKNPDFRDPKVWRVGGFWYMVLGLRDGDTGEVLLYKSSDLYKWDYQGVLARAAEGLGYMWECPDFYPLGNKYVLSMSPQGIQPKGYEYRNLYQSGYFVGEWRPGKRFNIQEDFTILDHGHDFYAPQSFLAPNGRRIMIGWMDMWNSSYPEDKQGWAGTFTLPREVTISKNNKLIINPIREIEGLRKNPASVCNTVLTNQFLLLDSYVTAQEIIVTWNLTASNAEKYGLRLGDKRFKDRGVYLYVDSQSNRLVLDRRYAQYGLSGYRSISLVNLELLTLRVFFDHSSIEVFVNEGQACMSSRIYPLKKERVLSLFAENGSAMLVNSSRWSLS